MGEGLGLGLGNQVAISTRGCTIWQGCRFQHNTGPGHRLIASMPHLTDAGVCAKGAPTKY